MRKKVKLLMDSFYVMWKQIEGENRMNYEQLLELYNNGWVRYALISILMIIVYKLGFERPLPLIKKTIVYIVLIIGCYPLVIFVAFGLPIIPALFVAALLMVAVRIRRKNYVNEHEEKGNSTK